MSLDQSLVKLAEDAEAQVRKLKNRLASGLGAGSLQTLSNLGFLKGLIESPFLESIVRRLSRYKPEKINLGHYLANWMIQEKETGEPMFIESGSTLAWFARELQSHLIELNTPLPPTIMTNNFLVQTLLFRDAETRVIAGALRKTYLAYLPFEQRADLTPDERHGDRVAFCRLDRDLSEASRIIATASTFGFLVGPLVGERANAIFKYGLFNNSARRPLKLIIAEPKVFRVETDAEKEKRRKSCPGAEVREQVESGEEPPMSTTDDEGDAPGPTEIDFTAAARDEENEPRYSLSPEHSEDTWSTHWHLSHCQLVFDLEHPSDTAAQLTQGPALDAEALVNTEVDRKGTAPAALGLKGRGEELLDGPPIFGTYKTWLGYLSGQPSGNIEIVIGCRSELRANGIRAAVADANRIIRELDLTFQYVELESSTNQHNVVHLVVRRRDDRGQS